MTEADQRVRIHVAPRTPGVPVVSFITYADGKGEEGDVLFSQLPQGFGYRTFTLESDAEDADYILAPHAVRKPEDNHSVYLKTMRAYAAQYRTPLLVFAAGDYHHEIVVDGAIVFKGSQYGHLKRENEILIPCFVEDLAEQHPISYRAKRAKPLVSFCGYADFPSTFLWVKYAIKIGALEAGARLLGQPQLRLYKRGLYWRRRAMRILRKDPRIETAFIARSSFSASAKLASATPTQLRSEYIENMATTDVALTPKGDANISLRFYEALSLGRIPLLIDTDVVLPGADHISYDEFTLRIPAEDTDRLGDRLSVWYEGISDEEFIAMQRRARAAFEQWLRYDRFFDYLFSTELAPARLKR